MPHAVAITPDGEFTGGRRDARQPVLARVDDQADHDARRAGLDDLDLDAAGRRLRARSSRSSRCSRAVGCDRRRPRRPSSISSPTPPASATTSGPGPARSGVASTAPAATRSTRSHWSPTPAPRFEYGISTDWLGRVIEAVSGRPLDAYLRDVVLAPLGMDDTTFHPTPEQRERLVRSTSARTARGRRRGRATGPTTRSGTPAATGCTPRRATTPDSPRRCSTSPTCSNPQVDFPPHLTSAHPRVSRPT